MELAAESLTTEEIRIYDLLIGQKVQTRFLVIHQLIVLLRLIDRRLCVIRQNDIIPRTRHSYSCPSSRCLARESKRAPHEGLSE